MIISSLPKFNSQKGYTLLVAVIVSVLVLSIAAFILSVSRKEAILASSARDSIYAFYAADSGLECAVENLTSLATSTYSPTPSISCGGIPINFISGNPGMGGSSQIFGTSTFSMSNSGTYSLTNKYQSGISSCASTSVAYVYTPGNFNNNGLATSTTVVVTVRGYNIGWDGVGTCSVTGPRKVERALQYTQYQ